MNPYRSVLITFIAVVGLVILVFRVQPGSNGHTGNVQPNASAESSVDLDPMTESALAMFRSADSMNSGADLLAEDGRQPGNASLAEIASHWRADAAVLRDRGVWMLMSRTAGSMTHNPDDARELDLRSLRANGESMILEGEKMSAHGSEMLNELVEQRDSGVLQRETADSLVATAEELVAAGTQMTSDGQDMRDYADRLLESIGD